MGELSQIGQLDNLRPSRGCCHVAHSHSLEGRVGSVWHTHRAINGDTIRDPVFFKGKYVLSHCRYPEQSNGSRKQF